MKTYVAFFRGINVGGKNVLPMRDLKSLLEDLGARDVKTYIQSGNAVFRSKEDALLLMNDIRDGIEKRHGFSPHVLLLGQTELDNAMKSNPFPEAETEPRSLHLFFLASVPESPDLEDLENMCGERERFVLDGRVFYLHAPDGIGRSKLAASVEKLLGVPATARNWRTVSKVVEMAELL